MAEKFGPVQGKFDADAEGNIEFDAVELTKYLKQLEFKFDEGGKDEALNAGTKAQVPKALRKRG